MASKRKTGFSIGNIMGGRKKNSANHMQSIGRAPIWGKLVKGVLVAAAISLVGMVVLAALVSWLAITDSSIQTCNQVLKLGSIMAGTFAAVGLNGEKGLLKGALVGLIYMALGMGGVSLFAGEELAGSVMASEMMLGMAVGGATGALCANLPSFRKA